MSWTRSSSRSQIWMWSLTQFIFWFGMDTSFVYTKTEIVKKELLIQVIPCKRMPPVTQQAILSESLM